MSDDNIFIQEVEEDLRNEQMKAYWDKYRNLIMAAVVGVVALVGGYKWWQWQQAKQIGQAAQAYMGGVGDLLDGKETEAAKAFDTLRNTGPQGYKLLAQFQTAAALAGKGKTQEALAVYDAISKNAGADSVLKDFSTIQSALLLVDTASYDDMKTRLSPLTVPTNSWRNSARELLGLSAYQAKKYEDAETLYNQILADREAPQDMQRRVNNYLQLVIAKNARKITNTKKAGDAEKTK